ncbi:MAG: inositol monophosphatase family protein [Rickettsiaceae bacterium]
MYIKGLVNAIYGASKLLHRDYRELAMMQSGSSNTSSFASRAYKRTKNALIEELERYKMPITSTSESDLFIVEKPNKQSFIMISPIDSIVNFQKSLPFFASSIAYIEWIEDKHVVTHGAMYFPVLGEIYYAQKGSGCWKETFGPNAGSNTQSMRMRISSQRLNKSDIIIVTDHHSKVLEYKNIRIFDSHCYDVSLLLQSKIDAVLHFAQNQIGAVLTLMVQESGGIIKNTSESFIYCNSNTLDQIL